jgi:hypothetical protein
MLKLRRGRRVRNLVLRLCIGSIYEAGSSRRWLICPGNQIKL